MKKTTQILFIFGSLLWVITACKKDKKTSELIDVKYSNIILNGNPFISVKTGGSYTDQGAVAIDPYDSSRQDLTPIKNQIDFNTPGMYPILFEAKNKYGFKSQKIRWVAVTNIAASENISGIYTRKNTLQEIHVDKMATGIYRVDNAGGITGNPAYLYNMYFVQKTDSTLRFPDQPGPFGNTYSKEEKLTKKAGVDTMLTWVLTGNGFDTAQRIFSRK